MDNNQSKIRILHVAQAAGGVDRYIRMLFKDMNHSSFENILICSHDFKREDYKGLADEFEQVDMQRQIGKADVIAMKKVRKLIKKYKPDIVYAHSSKAGAIARTANIGMCCKCIYNPHGWAFNMRCSKKKQLLYAVIEKLYSHFCDKIICISESEKMTALNKKICKSNKLQVILNGVDIEEYVQRKTAGLSNVCRKNLGIPENAFVVGMVGRISTQKAPDVFIKAARLIKEQIPESFFIIVGDGEQRDVIEEYAQKYNFYNSLKITGWVENALDYVDLFDVAMLLSRWEGFGLALPEYMLAGKPIVASNVDAIPSIIDDGQNGLLVEADNAEQASVAVIRLFKDSELRTALTKQGSITVHEKYDAKRVSLENEYIILSILH